ncbi:hypothetical protein OIU80_19100 [Flavobacterium sp. LS1R47]|uniref:Uncharacterized protein n=1 Tax=Flavobacterium frigoritolerans TaxID=2987686 RepID=A0A9X3CA65_9FLAO|nr:hypothetical protein [Flavobacterium frigoritolerans]MCV9934392.1 hypothetical protein [Flavobacterium frigoritolerans]
MAQREITNRTKSQADTVWLFDFLQKYWIIITGIILCYPLLKKWYEKFTQDAQERQLEMAENDLKIAMANPITKEIELTKITPRKDVHNIAESLAVWLGTNKQTKDAPWYTWITEPMSNFENERETINELLKVKNPTTVPLVIGCYYVITRRNLKADLKKYLSTSDLKKAPLFN